ASAARARPRRHRRGAADPQRLVHGRLLHRRARAGALRDAVHRRPRRLSGRRTRLPPARGLRDARDQAGPLFRPRREDTLLMIPVSAPDLSGNELGYVTDCVKRGWISSGGDYLERFETEWATYCGRRYGVAVANGTN